METKYVITLDSIPFKQSDPETAQYSILYRILGFDSHVFSEDELKRLIPLADELASYENTASSKIEEAYQKGLSDGKSLVRHDPDTPSSYLDGVTDMWNVVRRILLPESQCQDSILSKARSILGNDTPGWQIRNIFLEGDPEDILNKVTEYDKKKSPKSAKSAKPVEVSIGDEVLIGENTGIIFNTTESSVLGYIYPKTALQPVPFNLEKTSSMFKLTGKKHPEMVELVKVMNPEM